MMSEQIKRLPSMDVEYQNSIQFAISQYFFNGISKLISSYGEWSSPLDRVLWLKEELKKKSEFIQHVSDHRLREEIRQENKIQEMKNAVLYRSNDNARKMAITLSQIYCIAFNQPLPKRKVNLKKSKWYSCGKEYCDCPKNRLVSYFTVPGMTKNFKKLRYSNAELLMIHGSWVIFYLGRC